MFENLIDMLDDLKDTVIETYRDLRYGKHDHTVAVCHLDDFEFVNGIRAAMLAEDGGNGFRILHGAQHVRCENEDGSTTTYDVAPGTVVFLDVRPKQVHSHVMHFSREGEEEGAGAS